ncbi:cdkn1a interacting zinc finger protein 1a isoform X2 [Austrofundulus limnaeus]|uniref:Cdkn1a interacting zinc finger protein 1a isoform X2 n=1 Tax=Austrofundulus limnaeus TaxID=52670 RepID=A0A2I4BAX0_AUSLI|nr:PREDICTED: cip1-interacting zinc finger protein isoform X2 [Austrofundulus limnaeus]
MFNPHIHQQHQQQQHQFHQHLRQLQQLFQQQPPPPPPPQPPPAHHVPHHHQTPRAIPVPPQSAPPPRMVNLCQATQTTIIAPNPMLQGALLMQQMQGSMRGFGMGGQQFRQFFTAGTRSSLLGPVPMGMAIKSPMMGFPGGRPFHHHARFYNATAASTSTSVSTTDAAARQTDRKRDGEQMAAGTTDDQPAAAQSSSEDPDKSQTDSTVGGVDGGEISEISEEQLEEPSAKRQRTEGWANRPEELQDECVAEAGTTDYNSDVMDAQPEGSVYLGCSVLEDENFEGRSDDDKALEDLSADQVYSCTSTPSPSCVLNEDEQVEDFPAEEASQDKDAPAASPENQVEEEEAVAESSNKFYCYLCSITCHNQQNFRNHMNSISHQQRMMEIQHMSNACLVSLLPRVQESLQGANKDGEKKDSKHWCATCHTRFTCSAEEHHRSQEHKLASRIDISFCAVCKKHFKTSEDFLEHLHSQEHKQKLQDKGCETLTKLSSLDTGDFFLEKGEQEEEWQKNEGDEQDGWSSLEEGIENDVTNEEQYDPDTIYGSSFLYPVAGFICRLCNKFYLLESSALNAHCKTLKHFENLKRYRALRSQQSEAFQSSRESVPPADSSNPATETTTDCSFDTSAATDLNVMKPVVTVAQLKLKEGSQLDDKQSETDSASQDLGVSATGSPDENLSHLDGDGDTTAQEAPAENVGSETAAAAAEESNREEEEVVPASQGKKSSTGKAKTPTKRRSGRSTTRR